MGGKELRFPRDSQPALYPDVVRVDQERLPDLVEQDISDMDVPGKPVFAIIVEGRRISSCTSSLENEIGAEAWVTTAPAFQRKGYGRQVAAAWAHDLQQQGKIPFYSHRWDNLASESLARSLKLIQFMEDVAYK